MPAPPSAPTRPSFLRRLRGALLAAGAWALTWLVVPGLWLVTFGVGLRWWRGAPLPFEPEPVTFLLGLLSGAATALAGVARQLRERNDELEEERYSTSYALAYGYVTNFLDPVVTQLLSARARADGPLTFYVYVPDTLAELHPPAIKRTLARIRERRFVCDTVNLALDASRARDVLTVCRARGRPLRYFDFPTTLLTLVSLIDYKVDARKDRFADEEKVRLGRAYTTRFREAVARMVEERGLAPHVRFTDRALDFLDEPEAPPPPPPEAPPGEGPTKGGGRGGRRGGRRR
jgi:hypothetical protein